MLITVRRGCAERPGTDVRALTVLPGVGESMDNLDEGNDKRRVRARLTSVLRELGVSRPVSPAEFCRVLGDQRGRPIELIETALPAPGPFALLRAMSDRDQIIYPAHPSRSYQMLNIGHELTHLIFDHQLGDEDSLHHIAGNSPEPAVAAPISEEAAEVVRRWGALGRTSYESIIEREAEIGGSFLRSWLRPAAEERRRPTDPITRTIEDALGGSP